MHSMCFLKNKNLKLLSIHDVSSELAAKEAKTWQKLLRVLTHEISNSAIPLSTPSSYIYEMVMKANAEDRRLDDEERQDVMESLKAIEERSKSLKEFVNNFKNVNAIPELKLEKLDVSKLIGDLVPLFSKELAKEGIELMLNVPSQWIYVDKNLTEQVCINLILSADIFVIAALIAIGIALLTVTGQTLKVARANPVDSLRYE